MTLVDCPVTSIPSQNAPTSTLALLYHDLDASGEKSGCILTAYQTGNIKKIGYYVSQNASSGDADVRIETVGADALPTGTLFDTTTNGTETISSTGWKLTTLTSAAAVTKGDRFAIVITNTTGDYRINSYVSNPTPRGVDFPALYTTSWTKQAGVCLRYIEYDDATSIAHPNCWPVTVTGFSSYDHGDTFDDYGLRFQVPMACRLVGIWASIDLERATTVRLLDAADSLIGTALTFDSDDRVGTTGGAHFIYFDEKTVLTKDTTYRIVFEVTDTGTLFTLYGFSVNASSMLAYMPGGDQFYLTKRSGLGAFTDDQTIVPWMGLLVDQLDDGAGGGGTTIINRPRRVM